MKLSLNKWDLLRSASASQVAARDQNIPMMKLSVLGYDFSDLKWGHILEYNFQ